MSIREEKLKLIETDVIPENAEYFKGEDGKGDIEVIKEIKYFEDPKGDIAAINTELSIRLNNDSGEFSTVHLLKTPDDRYYVVKIVDGEIVEKYLVTMS